MTTGTLVDTCVGEVHRLHRVIADWTTGTIPDTDDGFAGFADAFAPTFEIVNPNGAREAATDVVPRFRLRHGERGGRDFSIRITHEDVRPLSDDTALTVYQEHWFHGASEQSVILASAVLRLDKVRPGGVAWLHLHETWLRAPS
ncbi:MAG: hypothetical protein RID42_13700 [Alphaproteobacteria bacterium]